MTQTIEPGQGTRNLTYRISPPTFRRPDATGEMPLLFNPGAPIGPAELNRLSVGETLILPTGAQPAPPREAVPTVYGGPQQRPSDYRSRHRMAAPWWMHAVWGAGAGMVLGALLVGIPVAAMVTR